MKKEGMIFEVCYRFNENYKTDVEFQEALKNLLSGVSSVILFTERRVFEKFLEKSALISYQDASDAVKWSRLIATRLADNLERNCRTFGDADKMSELWRAYHEAWSDLCGAFEDLRLGLSAKNQLLS